MRPRAIAIGAVLALALSLALPDASRAQEVYRDGDRSLSIGLWAQGWYQYVEDLVGEGGRPEGDLNDFLVRRVYLSVNGTVTPWLGFFVHVAGDRFGQRGLDRPGLASAAAWRCATAG